MDINSLGRLTLGIGVALVLLGTLFILLGKIPVFKHLGRLPGDIRIEGETVSCYFPIVSMLIISVLLTLIINIIVRLFNR